MATDLPDRALIVSGLWLALLASVATPILHVGVLLAADLDPVRSPVSALSRTSFGHWQTLGLVLFGGAHLALAVALRGLDHGRLWPYARLLLAASGVGLWYVAWYFATADSSVLQSAHANDPLWVVASLTGVAMGALQPGLARLSRHLGLFSVACLGAWLWLIPLILFVTDAWLGAYERITGSIYVVWMTGVSLQLLIVTGRQPPPGHTAS